MTKHGANAWPSRIAFTLVGIVMGLLTAFFFSFRENYRQAQVAAFVDQIISSAIDNSDFYKNHSTDRAAAGIEMHSADFTRLHRFYIVDKTFGTYQCVITCSNFKSFYVDVLYRRPCTVLQWKVDSFLPEKTAE